MTDFIQYPVGAPQMVLWDPAVPGFPYSTRWDSAASTWDAGATVWDAGASVWDAPILGETYWLDT